MKILLISDTHIHVWKSFNLDRNTMLSHQFNIQDDLMNKQVINLVRNRKIDKVIHGGDWFHEVGKIPVECAHLINKFMKLLPSNVTIDSVTGNHDLIKRISPDWCHSVTSLFCDKKDVIKTDGVTIGFIHFDQEVDYKKYVDMDIVIAHKTPVGAKFGKYVFADGVDWKRLSDNNRLVFFGHIHQQQKLAPNCYVIGSPMHFTFGDEGHRGVYIIDTEVWSVEFHKLKYPEFLTVDNAKQITDEYNYYRVLNDDGSKHDNAVMINKPRVFDERIKSVGLHDVVQEWTNINGKSPLDMDLIEGDLGKADYKVNLINDYKLQSVVISDFLSIGEAVYGLPSGFIIINGQVDTFSSNGSGKTALVDAIYWALYGKTTRGLTGDEVIRRGCKDTSVVIKLFGKEDTLIVERSRKNGLVIQREYATGEVCTEITAGLKQVDRQALLNKLLGFTDNLYLTSCYFSQESLTMLTGMTDVDRTNMITELLGFTVYDNLYVLMSIKSKECETKVAVYKRSIEDLENEMRINSARIDGLNRSEQEYVDMIKECEDKRIRLAEEHDRIKLKASSVSDEKLDETNYKVEIEQAEDKEKHATFAYEEIHKSIDGVKSDQSRIKIKIDRLCSTSMSINKQMTELKKQIDALSHQKFGERCDKCGSIITDACVTEFIAEKTKKMDDLKVELEANDNEAEEAVVADQSMNRSLMEMSETYNKLGRELAECRSSIKVLNHKMREQDERRRSVERERDRIEALLSENVNMANGIEGQIQTYRNKLKSINDDRCKYAAANVDLDMSILEHNGMIDTENWKLTVYEFYKDAFSSKGIKTLLLDRFCNDINIIINQCLSVISNGVMSITVTPTSVIKSGEERNKLGIEINMNGEVVKYESLSGGEKRRVDFSLCMALNQYVSSKFGLNAGLLGILIMDELFSYLDKSGEELIGQYLKDVSHNRTVMVITHTDELSLYADRCWTVIKENGVSCLEM